MSIAQRVLAASKLRQERHGGQRCQHGRGHDFGSQHAAPTGAWMVFWGRYSIDMVLLTELSRSAISS